MFVADEFVEQNFESIENAKIEYGDNKFFNEAPRHLYQLNSVCVNQAESSGSAGIDFYDWKLRNLIPSECLDDARNFYCHLCLI